jgi:hypothetical protein
MNKIEHLVRSFAKYISVPWRLDASAAQRVIFCVYDEERERGLRLNYPEFEAVAIKAGHRWAYFDLTGLFECWLANQRYAASYFQKPHLLCPLLPKHLDYITAEFNKFVTKQEVDEHCVVALTGVATLFGLLKVKDVVDRVAPLVRGRLVVFFPGSYENNNYRLLDGYDGWNYLAIPITAEMN